MNGARGVGPSRLEVLVWPPLPAYRSGDRCHTSQRLHRRPLGDTPGVSLVESPGDGRCAACRTPYKLHSQDVRSWVRG